MKCLCKISIIAHASAMAFSSAITYIAVNQKKKNIIQHPYWGKIFPFQNGYTYSLTSSILTIYYRTFSCINKYQQQLYSIKLMLH